MLTVYNEKKRKLLVLHGNAESLIRSVCENEENKKLFSKVSDDLAGKITFTSLSSTEIKINIGQLIVWPGHILIFKVT